jgi:hypothetical protein
VARHAGAPDATARGPPSLHHSVLVEEDSGQAAGEETEADAGVVCAARTGSCDAAVLDPNVVHPPAILSFAQRCPHHPGFLAVA